MVCLAHKSPDRSGVVDNRTVYEYYTDTQTNRMIGDLEQVSRTTATTRPDA
jgi:hypothetical protein